ncbi:MAG: CPBP family intramembrane metalloprotease [Candidatus Lokiarchaeota archaeon]|nr:CPBP family intramembrane metalloprotease [Candidatus Lokiarchaeota archaeon]MBD3338129.1 CPBP family intramembrane metalloprotease [Candidatus Lokiarchaeota archaeon]
MTIKNFVKQYQVIIYFILTFAISWGCIILIIGIDGVLGLKPISEELLPLVYIATLTGPSTAGLLMTALVYGRDGFSDLRSRLSKWRVNIKWYGVALIMTPILFGGLILILSMISSEYYPALFLSHEKISLILSGILVGLMVGFFEELGWTGFLIPQMRQHYSKLKTGIIVGFLWGLWHFPLFSMYASSLQPFAIAVLLARLFSWLPAFRVLLVWVFDRTESLLLVILMHASLVAWTTSILAPFPITDVRTIIYILSWGLVLWIIVIIISTKLNQIDGEET